MDITRRGFQLGLLAAGAVLPASGNAADERVGRPPADAGGDGILRRVDPELRTGAKAVLSHPLPSPLTLAAVRAMRQNAPAAPAPLPPPAATVERRVVPGPRGAPPIAVTVIGAKAGGVRRPAVLHIHGGGMILGRVADTIVASQRLAAELDCVVVEADYRLSPETPFPGPVEDCYAALEWLHANADALGVDRSRIAVMGESAGGGLAAMLAIAARDRRVIPLCYQVLIYPMLDDRTGSTRHVPPFVGTIGWNEAGNRFGWSSFLGRPAGSPTVPYGAVPARVANLSGLPPAFIGVGAIDLFVDEDIAYAARLVQAGVPTQLHVTPGAYHGFDFIVPQSRVAGEFTASWKSALRAAFTTAA
ncbi:alpha/beta hydrolase [Sphingomonas sp. AR_OL41]|uniref:alpha/beta hydrolase n=1 Tax=Sphingomonas sp. AR_OL41 TaxID=3042729 RepID=UPI00248050A9|nr:alpha/beta hydrolase [Sphingomonas sp. AR_OL41]MDH7972355.1 alpha/beta hydrolase [Sphingomonas sp. AR_OL41]